MAKVMVLKTQDDKFGGYMIFCPGCQCGHLLDSRWKFNGDFENPTFSPSMLVNAHSPQLGKRCHSFVRGGRIEFLSDCEHELAGKTVDMVDFDDLREETE